MKNPSLLNYRQRNVQLNYNGLNISYKIYQHTNTLLMNLNTKNVGEDLIEYLK